MKKNELEELFSDKKLEPNKAFEKRLFNTLQQKSAKKRWSPHVRIGAVFAITLVLLGFNVLSPSSDTLERTVLLKSLYAKAFASELPVQNEANFWKITQNTQYGAQAPLCANTPAGTASRKTTLLYDNGTQSAQFSKSTDQNLKPTMSFSSDKDLPAYDDSILGDTSSYEVRQYLANATLTDETGTVLPDDASVKAKTDGFYTIFAKIETPRTDHKNFTEGCSVLRIMIDIDAITGLYSMVNVYNSTQDANLTENNLSVSVDRTIETASAAQFDGEIAGKFVEEGFDIDTARSNSQRYDGVNFENKEAGYSFSYSKGLLGKPTAQKIVNSNSEVTAYSYSFPKQPSVIYLIYTNKASDIVDLRANISKENLTILTDTGNTIITMPGYGEVTQSYLTARNESTKYGLVYTGSSDIPAVYIEAPANLGVYTYIDQLAPDFPYEVDNVLSLLGVAVFKPGTEPPTGL